MKTKFKIKVPFLSILLISLLVVFHFVQVPEVKATPFLYEYYNAGDDIYTSIYDVAWVAQTFTVGGTGHTVTSVKLLMIRYGNPGTLTVGIRATSSGQPTGEDLTSGTIDANTFTTDSAGLWYEITVTTYNLVASTKYAIVCRVIGGSVSNYVKWRYDYTSPTYGGGNEEVSGNSGGTWTSESNYDMMFEVWGNSSPTNDALSLDLTGASYKSTKTLLAGKQDYMFVYKCSDVDGVTDITYAQIQLGLVDKSAVLRATRGSGDSWTFTKEHDPQNCVTLNTGGSSSSTSGNQKTFNFLVTMNWAWGDSAETEGVRCYVIDSQSVSDQDDYANIFGVEVHLTAYNLAVDDYRCNPSQTLTFSGNWFYDGTSIAPPNGNYAVVIKLSGVQKGSTDTTLVSGAFSINDVTAESSVGSYSYTVEATYMSGAGSFTAVIGDRVAVTITANTTSPAPYAYASFIVSAKYKYDDTNVLTASITINIFKDSIHFATGNFTDGGYIDVYHLYTTENITETQYGLTAFTSNTETVYWSTYTALTVRTIDLDSDVLTQATVYFNTTAVEVDENGYATKSYIVKYDNITIKVKWQDMWVNDSWTINMTTTMTKDAVCNVWNLTFNTNDNAGVALTLSSTQVYFTYPNGTSAMPLNTTIGTGSFKVANGTSYYKIRYQDQWVSGNTTLPMANANVTSVNINCWIYSLTVYVTDTSNSEKSGAVLVITRTDDYNYTADGLSPTTAEFYNSTHAKYVWSQLANQTSSYTVYAGYGGKTGSQETSLTENTEVTVTIPWTSGGTSVGPTYPYVPTPTPTPTPPTVSPTPTSPATTPIPENPVVTIGWILIVFICMVLVFAAAAKQYDKKKKRDYYKLTI